MVLISLQNYIAFSCPNFLFSHKYTIFIKHRNSEVHLSWAAFGQTGLWVSGHSELMPQLSTCVCVKDLKNWAAEGNCRRKVPGTNTAKTRKSCPGKARTHHCRHSSGDCFPNCHRRTFPYIFLSCVVIPARM